MRQCRRSDGPTAAKGSDPSATSLLRRCGPDASERHGPGRLVCRRQRAGPSPPVACPRCATGRNSSQNHERLTGPSALLGSPPSVQEADRRAPQRNNGRQQVGQLMSSPGGDGGPPLPTYPLTPGEETRARALTNSTPFGAAPEALARPLQCQSLTRAGRLRARTPPRDEPLQASTPRCQPDVVRKGTRSLTRLAGASSSPARPTRTMERADRARRRSIAALRPTVHLQRRPCASAAADSSCGRLGGGFIVGVDLRGRSQQPRAGDLDEQLARREADEYEGSPTRRCHPGSRRAVAPEPEGDGPRTAGPWPGRAGPRQSRRMRSYAAPRPGRRRWPAISW